MNQRRNSYNFGVKRVLVRSGVLLSVVFVGESLPTFGPVLDLVGGSTLTLTSLEKAGEKGAVDSDQPPQLQQVIPTSSVTLCICAFVILFGVICGNLLGSERARLDALRPALLRRAPSCRPPSRPATRAGPPTDAMARRIFRGTATPK
ncbi:Protein Y32F6A.4, partial [Aphelenchoides avenae]